MLSIIIFVRGRGVISRRLSVIGVVVLWVPIRIMQFERYGITIVCMISRVLDRLGKKSNRAPNACVRMVDEMFGFIDSVEIPMAAMFLQWGQCMSLLSLDSTGDVNALDVYARFVGCRQFDHLAKVSRRLIVVAGACSLYLILPTAGVARDL